MDEIKSRKYAEKEESKVLDYSSEFLHLPKSIFKTKLTVFEAIVFYFKEERKLSFREIAELLNRDERNIWTVYSRAKEKAKTWMR